MNTTITFPPVEPTLKLARPAEKWAATLAEERLRLQEDQEILRAREQNLREYESRLRLLQADVEAGRSAHQPFAYPQAGTPLTLRTPTTAPFREDPALTVAWDKLHRARELMDAELRNLRDERIALREMENQVRQREEVVAVREAQLHEREVVFTTASPGLVAEVTGQPVSTITRLTRAPFNMAMSVIRAVK